MADEPTIETENFTQSRDELIPQAFTPLDKNKVFEVIEQWNPLLAVQDREKLQKLEIPEAYFQVESVAYMQVARILMTTELNLSHLVPTDLRNQGVLNVELIPALPSDDTPQQYFPKDLLTYFIAHSPDLEITSAKAAVVLQEIQSTLNGRPITSRDIDDYLNLQNKKEQSTIEANPILGNLKKSLFAKIRELGLSQIYNENMVSIIARSNVAEYPKYIADLELSGLEEEHFNAFAEFWIKLEEIRSGYQFNMEIKNLFKATYSSLPYKSRELLVNDLYEILTINPSVEDTLKWIVLLHKSDDEQFTSSAEVIKTFMKSLGMNGKIILEQIQTNGEMRSEFTSILQQTDAKRIKIEFLKFRTKYNL